MSYMLLNVSRTTSNKFELFENFEFCLRISIFVFDKFEMLGKKSENKKTNLSLVPPVGAFFYGAC